MKAIIMCGLPGSGKSMAARQLAQFHDALIVSKDDIRAMLHGGRYVFDPIGKEPLVKNLAKLNVIALIESGHNVILDETNLTKAKRAEWIEFFTVQASSESLCPLEVFICHCMEGHKNIENRMKDPRGETQEYWEEVIERHRKAFEAPTVDEVPAGGTLIRRHSNSHGQPYYEFQAASNKDGATAKLNY